MEWITTILIALTALISAFTGTIIAIGKAKKQIEETFPEKLKRQNNINILIIERMEELKEFLKADRILVYDFHNGEHFANGRSALKLSCTFEVVRAGTQQVQRQMQSVPLSCIPRFINKLLTEEKIFQSNLEDMKSEMPGSYNLLQDQGIKSFYNVVLLNKQKEPIGILAVQFCSDFKNNFSENEINEILRLKFYIEENLDKMINNK